MIQRVPFAVAVGLLVGLAGPPAVAQDQSTETYQDWTVRCQRVDDAGTKACEMVQDVVVRDTGQRLMRLAVGAPPGAESPRPLAVMIVPLGVSLPAGVALAIDGGQPATAAYQRCEPGGCRAELPLDGALLDRLRGGRTLVATIQDGTGEAIEVPVSLLGFAAAYDVLTRSP